VKLCLVKLTLISSCALVATHASAQSSATNPTTAAATTAADAATPPAPKTLTAAANAKTVAPAAATKVTAAGSVIMLADGIVANARIAQIQPPAPGFVYER
jgi:hypothetical protein